MKRKLIAGVAAGAALLQFNINVASAASTLVDGPMGFDPIAGSAYGQGTTNFGDSPYVIPAGFTQTRLKDETTFNIYSGTTDDLTDMNTVNETGKHAGRYLYRTHEVGSNGAVSVVDLVTGETKILTQDSGYRRLDGIRWTPWGTLLFAEETTGGRVFEVILDDNDPSVAAEVLVRPALGIMAHEGIEALADGRVFVIDESNDGSIYMFVPDRRGDLSAGQLYAVQPVGGPNADGTGAFTWVAIPRSAAQVDARAAANALGLQNYERPEDVEVIGQTLYVAITGTDRVVAVDLQGSVITNFVKAGINVGVENVSGRVSGLNNPDNLAQGPDGRLWIVEDNDYSDIYVADGDNNHDGAADAVHLFASLKDVGAESSGIYFGKQPHTLYVNIQHPDTPLADGTWMITKQ